jgi:IS5 family transposase
LRHLIEEYGIGSQSFEAVKQVLKEQGALLQEGMILDATIMHAPSSTKNKKGEPDPEMHSVAKGDQWFFGMRCHIGVGAASGLVHSVVSTAANVHECNSAAERLHGEEKVAYGDSCHLGIEKREDFEGSSCQFRIAMRPGQRRALPDALKGWLEDLFEMAKAHLCAKVEHPFRMSKHQFGFQKTRCQSIKKNDDNLKMLFALASLYKIRK